jgi:hypothetical protein
MQLHTFCLLTIPDVFIPHYFSVGKHQAACVKEQESAKDSARLEKALLALQKKTESMADVVGLQGAHCRQCEAGQWTNTVVMRWQR